MTRRVPVILFVLAAVVVPASASAQSFGIGPLFSLVSTGTTDPADPATRFLGGAIRARMSPHIGFEASLNYRSYMSPDLTTRTSETPLEASLLVFLIHARVSPYLVGGAGIYSQQVDTLDLANQSAVVSTTTSRKIGWHAGIGAEVTIVKHAGVFVDYRYRFVKFGADATADTAGQSITIPGLSNLVNISHEGSMWTGGVAFYF